MVADWGGRCAKSATTIDKLANPRLLCLPCTHNYTSSSLISAYRDSLKPSHAQYIMEKHTIRLPVSRRPTGAELQALRAYFGEMPVEEILTGLKFANNRRSAKDAGTLKVGRKSIIKKEVHSVTAEQATWRLNHWKMMIANYRRRGYSYPTISRIKKILIQKSADNVDVVAHNNPDRQQKTD